MFLIAKELIKFSASHVLHGMPKGHKCGNIHGHDYKVVLYLASNDLDNRGMVMDFGDLKTIKDWIDSNLDHAHLATTIEEAAIMENAHVLIMESDKVMNVLPVEPQKIFILNAPSTAESIAKVIYDNCIELMADIPLLAVQVWETDKAYGIYADNEITNTLSLFDLIKFQSVGGHYD